MKILKSKYKSEKIKLNTNGIESLDSGIEVTGVFSDIGGKILLNVYANSESKEQDYIFRMQGDFLLVYEGEFIPSITNCEKLIRKALPSFLKELKSILEDEKHFNNLIAGINYSLLAKSLSTDIDCANFPQFFWEGIFK